MDFEEKTKPYRSYVQAIREEISFCRGTGYDKEKTAVVPLAELARREEDRLRRLEVGGAAPDEEEQPGDDELRRRRGAIIPVGEIVDVLRAAATVEEVAGVLTEIVSNVVPRVLLLWERRGTLYGFASSGMGLSEVKLLTIEVPRRVLQDMTGTDLGLDSFAGPPRMADQVPRFFEILGRAPPEVLLVPVQVTASDRWVLYADAGENPLPPFELRLIEVISSRAGARADLLLDGKTW
jgi:hypothetical protein